MRKKILCAVWSAAFVLLCGTAARGVTTTTVPEPLMKNYVYPPIFQSSAVLPNIMIILDHSGSMCYPAYPAPFVPDANNADNTGEITGANYQGLNCRAVVPVSAGTDDAQELNTSAGTIAAGDLTANPLIMSRATSGTNEYIVGLRFANVKVPKSVNGVAVTIKRAYIRFTAQQAASVTGASYTIAGQNLANPTTFTTTAKNISSRTWLGTTVPWSATSTGSPLTAWELNKKYDTPDLTAIVSLMVANASWASGNAMVFKITGASGSKRYPYSFNGNSKYAPQLIIEYEPCIPKEYYGIFVPAARYVYDSTGPYFKRTTLTDSTTWSGNFLNWMTMRRFDILKKVLVGGKRNVGVDNNTLLGEGPFNLTASAYTNDSAYWQTYYLDSEAALTTHVSPYPEAWYGVKGGFLLVYNTPPLDNSTAGFPSTGSSWGTTATAQYKIAVKRSRTDEPDDYCADDNGIYNLCGVMQRIGTQAQWGNLWYYDLTPVNAIGTPIATIVRTIEAKVSEKSTPVADAIGYATTYFKGGTAKGDPFKDAKGNIIPCAKSYLLLLTDGEPNTESKFSDLDGDGNDGQTTARPYDAMNDRAFYAHTTDLRTDISGKQSIDFYVVYAFGTSTLAPVILRETAMYGGFRDLNGNGVCDGYGKHPTASYGSNPSGLLSAFTQYPADMRGEWDKDGDGVPDNYYEAQNGDEIESQVLAAINDILNKAASGTAVSVLATTGEGEGTLVQAIFLPGTVVGTQEVNWLGRVQSMWVDTRGNIREDSTNDMKLDVTTDKVITFYMDLVTGQTMITRYAVSATVPYPDTATATGTAITLDDVQPIWEGGAMLADRDPADRKIYTYVRPDNASVIPPSPMPFYDPAIGTGYCVPFTAGNAFQIRKHLGIENTDSYSYLHATNPQYRAENLIEYIRGKEGPPGTADVNYPYPLPYYAQVRNRTLNKKVWKLGDVVYSTPVTISKPVEKYDIIYDDTTYGAYQAKYGDCATTARESIVYVGANDGMLHAFTSGIFDKATGGFTAAATTESIGDELWAYIPRALLPHLKWLADPKYGIATHVPFVDLKPKIVDVRIFDIDADHPYGWGTVLIGGFNFGGKYIWTVKADGNKYADYYPSFFAIDITNPRKPQLLWDRDFPDMATGAHNMGLSTNQPTVLTVGRTFDSDNRTWLNSNHPCSASENFCDHWYLAIGSGFDDFNGWVPPHKGSLYIVDIKTGALKKQFQTTENAYMNAPIALDKSLNFSVDAVYVAGNYYDNTTTPYNKSKVWRVGIPITSTPYIEGLKAQYQWDPSSATNPWTWNTMLTSSTGTGAVVLPTISAAFTISTDDKDNVWVYPGTGKFQVSTDKTDISQNYLLGIKDPFYNRLGLSTSAATSGTPSCYHDYTPAAECTLTPANLFNASPYVIKPNRVVEPLTGGISTLTSWDALLAEVKKKTGTPSYDFYKGWYRAMNKISSDPTERMINKPTVFGGIAMFPTYSPNTNACSYGGSSNLYALYYLTGTAYRREVLLGMNNTVKIQDTQPLGYGLSSSFGIHAYAEDTNEATVYSQMSTGVINKILIKPVFETRSGIESWKEATGGGVHSPP